MILDPHARLAPAHIADATAFAVGTECYTWDDIVLAATTWTVSHNSFETLWVLFPVAGEGQDGGSADCFVAEIFPVAVARQSSSGEKRRGRPPILSFPRKGGRNPLTNLAGFDRNNGPARVYVQRPTVDHHR